MTINSDQKGKPSKSVKELGLQKTDFPARATTLKYTNIIAQLSKRGMVRSTLKIFDIFYKEVPFLKIPLAVCGLHQTNWRCSVHTGPGWVHLVFVNYSDANIQKTVLSYASE